MRLIQVGGFAKIEMMIVWERRNHIPRNILEKGMTGKTGSCVLVRGL